LSRRLKIFLSLALAVAALDCAAMAVAAGGGAAGFPAGPRISFLEVHYPAKQAKEPSLKQLEDAFRLVSVDAEGHDLRRFSTPGLVLAGLGNVSWSAEGEQVAFLATPESRAEAEGSRWQIYVAGADRSEAHAVPGTKGASRPVLSPDGRWVAFARYRERTRHFDPKNPIGWFTHRYASTTTWIAPVAGGKPRRLTPWGNGRFSSPSSFSPDGSLLAVSVDSQSKPEAVDLLDAATGKPRKVEAEASEAAFSPDGSRIAFSSYRDHGSAPRIRRTGSDGRALRGERRLHP
jgi:dipeptidyl aminopeptidase/acylaminoacyl peptidase